MNKDEILKGLRRYAEAAKFIDNNDLCLNLPVLSFQVSDGPLVLLSRLFDVPVRLESNMFENRQYTQASINFEEFEFYSWDFSWSKANAEIDDMQDDVS